MQGLAGRVVARVEALEGECDALEAQLAGLLAPADESPPPHRQQQQQQQQGGSTSQGSS